MEERVLPYVHDDIQVTGWATAITRFTFAAEAQPLAACDAGRNLHGELPLLLHMP